jgi:hypothetical protein
MKSCIAAAIAPGLLVRRGAASAAHEFLLEELGRLTKSQAYTWNPIDQEMTGSA